MFFEKIHSTTDKEFFLSDNTDLTFPLHLHKAFEVFFQIQGETEIIIDDKNYLLKEGQAVLIFPFQKHSYKCIKKGKVRCCVFSTDMAQDFYNIEKLPTDNLFTYISVKAPDGFWKQIAFVYSVIGEFEKDRRYRSRGKGEDVLLKVLLTLEDLYKNNCTLLSISKKVGYDYAYISKLFKRKVGMPFNTYLNQLRINDAKDLILNTEKSITEIAEICGFDSLRTFNRIFLNLVGVNPSTYRKNLK